MLLLEVMCMGRELYPSKQEKKPRAAPHVRGREETLEREVQEETAVV